MKAHLNKIEQFLLFFSSEDVYVIEKYLKNKSGSKKELSIKYYFLTIGFAVLIFFVYTAISTIFFIYNIFDGFSKLLSIPIGLFIGLLLANIYLFLLYTITPSILFTADKKKKRIAKIKDIRNTQEINSLLSSSFFFRGFFIVFIALTISQPLNVWLLIDLNILNLGKKEIIQLENYRSQSLLDSYIINDEHYSKLFKDLNNKEELIYSRQFPLDQSLFNIINKIKEKEDEDLITIEKLKAYKFRLQELNKNFLSKKINYKETENLIFELNTFIENVFLSDENFTFYLNNLRLENLPHKEIIQHYINSTLPFMEEKIDSHNQLKELLHRNSLYTLKIKLLMGENIYALILSLVTICFFLAPGLAKFLLRKKFNYYKFRSGTENAMIIDFYKMNCETYKQILNQKVINQKEEVKVKLLKKIEILKDINISKYELLKHELEIEKEYSVLEKYEHWADAPFRTLRKSDIQYPNNKDLLAKIYS